MKSNKAPRFLWCAVALALAWPGCLLHGRPLTIAGNAGGSYEPASSFIYSEMRSRLTEDFPGTTFVTLAALTGSLSGFDLLVLNRFASEPLTPAEQTNIYSYVLNGGNLLYVGEDTGLSNDTFTLPFGIAMAPDPTTDNIAIAFATYTNAGSPFLNGPFGAPSNPPSGSDAAKIITLGPSVELARWNGGGTAISAFGPNILAPGAGFGVFVTDANMMTPTRYSLELGDVVSNALLIPEPSSLTCLFLGAAGCFGRRRFFRTSRGER